MERIGICYTKRQNMGDLINPYIIENISNRPFFCDDRYSCDMSGIGSGLRRFFIENDNLKHKMLISMGKVLSSKKPLILWSAGFGKTPSDSISVIRENVKVASVRGELSKSYVERLLNQHIECSTGDAGLLSSRIVKGDKGKKYTIGIIPHDCERNEVKFYEIAKQIPGSIVVDVRDDALKNLTIISQCEAIISSSLHGLIIADSFHVPNMHVVLTNKLAGDGFKFDDYYSSYDIEHTFWNLNTDSEITKQRVIDAYKIKSDEVEKKKEEIVKAFYKYL